MKTYTPNYNLVKPGQDDFYNVDDFNANADILDAQLKAEKDRNDTHATKEVLDHPDGSVTDAKIGNRSIDDTVQAAGGIGLLSNLLSKIGFMIKSITGKSNWYTLPAITLENINNLFGLSGHSHNGTAGQGPKIAYSNITGAPSSLPANGGDADTLDTKHASDFAPSGYGLGTGTGQTIADCNAATKNGFYGVTDAASNRPPVTFGGVMIVTALGDSEVIFQIFCHAQKSTGSTWVRSYQGINGWSAWKQVWTSGEDGSGSGLDADTLDT
jgi:hypothetical protein